MINMLRSTICFVVLFGLLQKTSGVIYSLNETEYDRLPPLFSLEPFYPCLRESGDLYCHVNAQLVNEGHNELLTILQEYSANNITHYDHTLIHWGICVTKTCRDQLSNYTDLHTILEACLNNSLTRSYNLQTRLDTDSVYCTEFEEPITLDKFDIAVATVFLVILALNVLGTVYDLFCAAKANFLGRFLLCFSTKSNWFRLVAPSGEGPEPRLRRLKCFNGLKVITTCFVVMGHSPLTALIASNNPQFIESSYYDPTFHVFYNGNLIVQMFLIMSGFLLVYHILIVEEKRQLSWVMIPKGIGLRWLRLTPPYAVILAFISTWLRFLGNGPLWKPVVGVEVMHCRRDWFYNLLYVNNYVDHSQCMAHTWYLAVDMQLTVLGLLIFCVLRGPRARKVAVSMALVAGLVAPAVETYLHNLHAKLLVTPEVARNYFVEDPTFNHLYKRTHTNLECYVMGMALAMWFYTVQTKEIDLEKYKRYRYLYWAIVPAGLVLILVGGVFFIDGIQVPLPARMLYASVMNPLFGMLACILLPCTIFKLENVYRGILEWRGWAPLARISYCAYLVHATIVRTSTANHDSLIHSNFYQIFITYCGQLVITFMAAAPCWMLVEAPFSQLMKLLVSSAKPTKERLTGTQPTTISKFNRKEFDEA